MAWTEQDYQEIVARLMANSIGVNEVPNADKADDVTSLPAFKPSGSNSEASVVNYPLEFLKGEQGEPGIQGEPGKSFKVAGEYATLEALKSAVPDGSAVDGFMAVGTEAPYDYYAWVNGEWVSQGKIGGIDEAPTDGKAYGRKNGGWAEVPEHLNLTSENLNDINGAGFATQKSPTDYTSPENNYPINENGALIFANANYGHSNQIYGSYLTNRWFARGGGNQHGVRTNWKEFAFTDDVLTKTNTSSFTPTGDYQPATKKYVDNIGYGKVIDVDGNDPINNINAQGTEAENRINRLFGSINSFKNVVIDIANSHAKYHFHLFNLTSNCIEMGSVFAYVSSSENNRYLLSFIFTYLDYCKHCKIDVTDVSKEVIIKDLVASDNLTTLTKKTKSEFNSIPTKDNSTMYAVTE